MFLNIARRLLGGNQHLTLSQVVSRLLVLGLYGLPNRTAAYN